MRIEILKKIRDYLKNNPTHNLYMDNYVSNDNTLIFTPTDYESSVSCGTSTCVAGLIPLVDPDFAKGFIHTDRTYDFCKMSMACVGKSKELWNWLFHPRWGNDVDDAIKRLDYIINGGTLYDWSILKYNEYTKKTMEHVIQNNSQYK